MYVSEEINVGGVVELSAECRTCNRDVVGFAASQALLCMNAGQVIHT